MSTHLGVSVLLTEQDIQEDVIKKSQMLYIEGYLWLNEKTRNAALKAIDIAKKNQIPVGFTFSDGFVVQQYKKDFLKLMEKSRFFYCFYEFRRRIFLYRKI
jgi:sugar/nucleoside kinase (ribokinase family)